MSSTRDTDTNNQEYAIPVIEIDAYAPAKMADRVGRVGVAKSQLSTLPFICSEYSCQRLYRTWYAAFDAGDTYRNL